jgi:CMP-N-acetylneuraminic acid synthetase
MDQERALIACVAAAAGYAAALCSVAGSSPAARPAPRSSAPPSASPPAAAAPAAPAVEVENPTIVALVPMKHTSLRVPGKNYRKLGDKPLCCWVLQTLCDCDRITKVVVDTDSDTVKAMLTKEFPQIEIIDRPAHLLNDPPMNEILLYDTGVVKADFYFQTHVTNPFLKKETIDAALDNFLSQYPYQCDSLFAVRQWQTRLYDQLGNAVSAEPEALFFP